MADQTLIRTYGNTNLPDETEDRPLVTLALLAYNQEKYICEAVEGAFSQTYTPLEIVLSDDCSSDRTFEIIEEMAQKYRGNHKVHTVRNKSNLGLIDHLTEIIKMKSGDYIVLAAGDDISLPNRTEISISHLRQSKKWLLHTNIQSIDASGNVLRNENTGFPLLWSSCDIEKAAVAQPLYFGATGAFNVNLFSHFEQIKYKRAYEDDVLGFRAILSGGAAFLDEKLVKYRTNVGVSSEATRLKNTPSGRAAKRKMLLAHLDTMLQRLEDYKATGLREKAVIAAIEYRIHEIEMRLARGLSWSEFLRLGARKPILTIKICINHLQKK